MPSAVTHSEHVLLFVLDGWVELEHGRPVRAEGGSAVIVPAGIPHRGLGGRQLDAWSVGFCSSCLDLREDHRLMQPFARVRRGALPLVQIPRKRRRYVTRLCKELQAETARITSESLDLMRAQVSLLLGELLRSMPQQPEDQKPGSLVSAALAFVQLHALEPISLQDVAAAVHRSPAHVTTSVRKATGHSVGSWIVSAKVAEAARWLMFTDASLEEIAQRIGWQDKTHFIRQFKKAHGQTPAAWRRKHRSGDGG